MSVFNNANGRRPQTEARRWVYNVLVSILDNPEECSEEGWFALGPDGDEFDRRRLKKALGAVKKEMLRKANR